MRSRAVTLASWLLGVLGVVAVVVYVRPHAFLATLQSVGVSGGLGWLVLMLAARLLMIEGTVLPLSALGPKLGRPAAFWIGWIRSFTNQVLPLAGLALYAQQIRRLTGASWSELTALSSIQVLLATTGLGLLGVAGSFAGLGYLGSAALPTLALFAALAVATPLLASNAAGMIDRLPRALSERLRRMSDAFRRLADQPGLIARLVLINTVAILVSGSRLWVLFLAAGLSMDWQEALLMIAIAEATALFQLTPGALGLREGAIVGAAVLLGLPAEAGASVALVDRLFIIAVTTLFAAPAVAALRAHRPPSPGSSA